MVVPNLEEAINKYVYEYGIGPMYVIKFSSDNVSNMYLHSKKVNYSMNLAVCPVGDVRFELIEPISESIYSEYYNNYGEGIIHHLKLGIENYNKTLHYLESNNIENIQSGHQLGDLGKNKYTYLDTMKSLGFVLEIVDISCDFIKPKPDYWFPENIKNIPKAVFLRPIKVGIVVKDLSNKIKQYSDLFNLRPWRVKIFDSKNVNCMHVNGKKKNYSMKIGFYNLGNLQLKLIESLSDSIFLEFNEKYGEGVAHHLVMEVENFNSALNFFRKKGINIIQSGRYLDKIKFAYLDTSNDLNYITEIIEKEYHKTSMLLP